MKKINYKGRCEKRKVSKCKDVCRTYSKIQSAMRGRTAFHFRISSLICFVSFLKIRFHTRILSFRGCIIQNNSYYTIG